MKRTAIFLLFLLPLAALGAQEDGPSDSEQRQMSPDAPWRLVVFPPGELDGAASDISGIIEEGFMPVGLEIEPSSETTLLFVQAGDAEVQGWAITDYLDWNQLEAEITATIRQGFVPMDISRYGDALGVLWVRMDLPIAGWRIHAAENTAAERADTLNRFQEQGFSLWGVSLYQDLLWYLFIRRDENQTAGAISLYGKDLNEVRGGIVTSGESGWLPSGIAVTEQNVLLSYMR